MMQAVGPGGGRRPVRNPHRPAQITRGGLLGNRSRPIRAILGGARSSNQVRKRLPFDMYVQQSANTADRALKPCRAYLKHVPCFCADYNKCPLLI